MKWFLPFLALAVMVSQLSCTTNDPTTGGPTNYPPETAVPVASFTVTKSANFKVSVDASGMTDPLNAFQVRWDWTDDGTWDTDFSDNKTASTTYPGEGTYTIRMEVRDPLSRTDTSIKQFKVTATNTAPKASFAVNVVKGMTASVDASNSSDAEDNVEDLQVRWDWTNDGTWDTDYTANKAASYDYTVTGDYTIKMQVKDLNDSTGTKTEKITVSPITIRSSFFTLQVPYVLRINFRLINNLLERNVNADDIPLLARHHFAISEDDVPIDLSETNQILTAISRPMYLVLVLDYTGSMSDAGGIDTMVDAAKTFIDNQPETTRISLWAMWDRLGGHTEIDDYTICNDEGKVKLKADLDAFTALPRDHGASQIWDLLYKILFMKFLPVDNGENRAIVFLSDGHDTASDKTVSQLISESRKKRPVSFFSIGLGFRPDTYPADEGNLKKIAEDTGGTYFSINQISDLNLAFTQLGQDLKCDWTLSYVSLATADSHHFDVLCNYLDGKATITGARFSTADIAGDQTKGLIDVRRGSPTGDQTEYVISTMYMPRNIKSIRIRVNPIDGPATLTLYDSDAICTKTAGWTITPDVATGQAVPADGWYSIASESGFEFGALGKIARCTVTGTGLPSVSLELTSLVEQPAYYGDKTVVFAKTNATALAIPTVTTGITAAALVGTPADPAQASANPEQVVTLSGRGFSLFDVLVYMDCDGNGSKELSFVGPSSVAPDGQTITYQLPKTICTSKVWVLDDYLENKYFLQIVPTVTKYDATYGKFTGVGFIEGGMRAVVAGTTYMDNGPGTEDGIDVTGTNCYFKITGFGGGTPVYVITDGGTSNTYPAP